MIPERFVRRPLLASALAYIAITIVMGRHVLAAIASSIASDSGDPLLTTGILFWNATHLPWTHAWYQFPIFSPTADALVLSEHLLGVSVIAAPVQWLTGSPVIAYNLTVLLSYPLCGIAMYALVRHLTQSTAAAFLAGMAYAFAPFRASHLPHIQMLVSFGMPLALLGLHRYLESRRRRWLLLFGVAWTVQGAANGYYLVYFTAGRRPVGRVVHAGSRTLARCRSGCHDARDCRRSARSDPVSLHHGAAWPWPVTRHRRDRRLQRRHRRPAAPPTG